VDQSFTAVAIPGNAELHSEVENSNQQQQAALSQQDAALDRIEEAAARVGRLGLAIGDELRVRVHALLLRSVALVRTPIAYIAHSA
jgi:hypothetical protein